jgi:hypothetical protein
MRWSLGILGGILLVLLSAGNAAAVQRTVLVEFFTNTG